MRTSETPDAAGQTKPPQESNRLAWIMMGLVVLVLALGWLAGPWDFTLAQAKKLGQPLASAREASLAAAREVQEAFVAKFPAINITEVREVRPNLYEILADMDLLYTDSGVTWVMQGNLIDTKTRENLTAARLHTLGDIAFDKLPLDLAIKEVKGNGTRRMAIFEDPNCGYCKKLRHEMVTLDDVTIYVIPYAVLGPDSVKKADLLWCTSNPGEAWNTWMVQGALPKQAAQGINSACKAPTQQTLELGRRLHVQGTPTLYFADGTHISGTIPLENLQAKLDGKSTTHAKAER